MMVAMQFINTIVCVDTLLMLNVHEVLAVCVREGERVCVCARARLRTLLIIRQGVVVQEFPAPVDGGDGQSEFGPDSEYPAGAVGDLGEAGGEEVLADDDEEEDDEQDIDDTGPEFLEDENQDEEDDEEDEEEDDGDAL